MFPSVVRMVRRASDAGMVLACLLLVLAVSHVLTEIIAREFFRTSTHMLDELIGYAVCGITFFSLSYCVRQGAMVRVNMLTQHAGRRLGRWIEIVTATAALLVTSLLIYYSSLSVIRNLDRGAKSETIAAVPLWIPEGFMLIGLILLALELAVYITELALGRAEVMRDSIGQ